MTVTEALNRIHSFPHGGLTPGLERPRALLARLGNPQNRLSCIHIAGTNGKGSTAAMLAAVLQAAGYRVGLFTSPFIHRFHERIQINGNTISDEALAALTARVVPHAEALPQRPTEFELVTAMAFSYFAEEKCDFVVVEAGMGGELDATNVISAPLVSVITNIGLDHTEFLGDTLEKIAAAKAGIIKEGGTAVIYPAAPSVEQVFEERCALCHARLQKADFDSICPVSHDFSGQVFHAGGYENLQIPLLGAHQLKNAAMVLKTTEVLREQGVSIPENALRQGLRSVFWPGRFEVLCQKPLFLVDGGHNPQCIGALAENIRDYLGGRSLIVLTGVMKDKDYGCMYSQIAPFAREFITVTPASPRALPAEALKAYLSRFQKPATPCQSVQDGVKLALQKAGADSVVLAYGSLYMVGDIRDAVAQEISRL